MALLDYIISFTGSRFKSDVLVFKADKKKMPPLLCFLLLYSTGYKKKQVGKKEKAKKRATLKIYVFRNRTRSRF